MPELFYECPVKVPADVRISKSTEKRFDSGFSPSLTIEESIAFLEEEVQRLPDSFKATLFTNYNRITVPRLRQRIADDSTASLQLARSGNIYFFVSHQWGMTEQNIYALHLALRAIHNIVKWGVSDFNSLLSSFAVEKLESLPSYDSAYSEEELVSRGQWLAILRLGPSATLEDANEAYRFYAKKAAASEEGLLRLNQAIAAARAFFSKTN